MFFSAVQPGPVDVFNDLKAACDSDRHPAKVDLGVGVYRNDSGEPHEYAAQREAKRILFESDPGHEYQVATGSEALVSHGARLVFGDDLAAELKAGGGGDGGRLASVQTLSGTGALHTGAMLLRHGCGGGSSSSNIVYLGNPTWGNYEPLYRLAGFETRTYDYLVVKRDSDRTTTNTTTTETQAQAADFASLRRALLSAPRGSLFPLQSCCYNPCAVGYTRDEWTEAAEIMASRGLLPVFDVAYQGLGRGIDDDAWPVRHFAGRGDVEMMVAQSFSKNLAMYGERVGCLHVVLSSGGGSSTPQERMARRSAAAVRDQLRCMVRWEYATAPLYGSRVVELILGDEDREARWREELAGLRDRLRDNRERLCGLLRDELRTPGEWGFVTRGEGLFTFLPLTGIQVAELAKRYHIYMAPSGRLTISGLNENNIEYVARSIDAVVRAI